MKYTFWLLTALLLSFSIRAQQTSTVDFKTIKGQVSIFPDLKTVQGDIEYTFAIKKDADSIFINGRNMDVQVMKNSPTWPHLHQRDGKIWLIDEFEAGKTYSLRLHYKVEHPKQSIYFEGWDDEGTNQIWTQGEGKYTSYWLPSIDDMNDKIRFDLTYYVPKGYTVIGNGK